MDNGCINPQYFGVIRNPITLLAELPAICQNQEFCDAVYLTVIRHKTKWI